MSARRSVLWVLVLAGCHPAGEPAEPKAKPVEVRCVHPTRAKVTDTLALRGRIDLPPGGDLSVASQVPGKIAQVFVVEGQTVAKGDAVAAIDDAPSRDAVRQADAAVVQARAALVNANVTLARTKTLVDKGIAPKQELDDATARADSAKGALDSAIAAADLARRTLNRVVLKTAFAATVTKVLRGPGALVDGTPTTPIAQLASQELQFVADVTQQELAQVRIGQTVEGALTAAADGKTELHGTVSARASAIDPATGFGVVRVGLTGAPASAIGSYGRVVVTLGSRENVLVVPPEAIRGAVADGVEIVLCKEGKAEVKEVKLGVRDQHQVEVVSGVGEGDEVAIDHVLGLETGTELTAKP